MLIYGRIDIPLVDKECHTEYYLVCLNSENCLKEYMIGLFIKTISIFAKL